jgi:hypothetical protein
MISVVEKRNVEITITGQDFKEIYGGARHFGEFETKDSFLLTVVCKSTTD